MQNFLEDSVRERKFLRKEGKCFFEIMSAHERVKQRHQFNYMEKNLSEILSCTVPWESTYFQNFLRVSKLNTFCMLSSNGTSRKGIQILSKALHLCCNKTHLSTKPNFGKTQEKVKYEMRF